MTEKNEPAFPVTEQHGANSGCTGMTLRDYFAAKAMQAIISTAAGPIIIDGFQDAEPYIAVSAYKMADAMLKARGEQ